jgi:pimeloyl-ACP methyl ester carboxylesterase
MAQSLLALERYDEAADAYLRLIALDRGANGEDVNALQLFVARTTRYSDGSIQRTIDDAVAEERRREVVRIELEGGSLVTIRSADGVPLEATLRRAEGPGAVLFVHETGSRRSVFTPYAQLLFIDEISSLAVDLRGHGGSRADSMLAFDALSAYNHDQLPGDVAAAYRYLENTLGIDEGHIAIIAAGHASAVVEKALYREHIDAPVVYLSPTFLDSDLEVHTAVSFHPATPALLVGGREDWSALRAIQAFTAARERPGVETRLYDDAGHGVETLRRVPAALEYLQRWLRATVGSG